MIERTVKRNCGTGGKLRLERRLRGGGGTVVDQPPVLKKLRTEGCIWDHSSYNQERGEGHAKYQQPGFAPDGAGAQRKRRVADFFGTQ